MRYRSRQLQRAARRGQRVVDDLLRQIVEDHLLRGDEGDDSPGAEESQDPRLDVASSRLQRIWERNAVVRESRSNDRRFERHQRRRWVRSLNLAETMLVWATHVGALRNHDAREAAAANGDFRFDSLTALHARSCSAFGEVLALSRAGYPAGVYARWRLLHELDVVSAVLGAADQAVCEAYLLHDGALRSKRLVNFNAFALALGQAEFSEDEIEADQRVLDELKARFGNDFADDWAWGKPLLPNRQRVTFADLEQLAALAHLRPHVQLASSYVHGGAHGTALGRVPVDEDVEVLVAGRRDDGISEALHGSAQALMRVTTSLLMRTTGSTPTSGVEALVQINTLLRLSRDLGEACAREEDPSEDDAH